MSVNKGVKMKLTSSRKDIDMGEGILGAVEFSVELSVDVPTAEQMLGIEAELRGNVNEVVEYECERLRSKNYVQ
jgi:hypothetical protein